MTTPPSPGTPVRRLPRRRTSRRPRVTPTGSHPADGTVEDDPAALAGRWASPSTPRLAPSAALRPIGLGDRVVGTSSRARPGDGAARGRSCTRGRATRAATRTSGSGCRRADPKADERCGVAARHGHAGRASGRCCPRRRAWRSRCTRCPNLHAVNVVIHGLLGLGRRGVQPVRPAGQGAGRVGPVAARRRPGGAAVSGVIWSDRGAGGAAGQRPHVRRARGAAAPRRVGGRRRQLPRELHRRGGQAGLPRRLVPRGGRRSGRRAARLGGLTEALMEAGASGGVIAEPVDARHRAAAHRRRAATPTSSTGSCARRWPAS